MATERHHAGENPGTREFSRSKRRVRAALNNPGGWEFRFDLNWIGQSAPTQGCEVTGYLVSDSVGVGLRRGGCVLEKDAMYAFLLRNRIANWERLLVCGNGKDRARIERNLEDSRAKLAALPRSLQTKSFHVQTMSSEKIG